MDLAGGVLLQLGLYRPRAGEGILIKMVMTYEKELTVPPAPAPDDAFLSGVESVLAHKPLFKDGPEIDPALLAEAVGTGYDLRTLAEAVARAKMSRTDSHFSYPRAATEAIEAVTRLAFAWTDLKGCRPDDVWPFFVEHPDGLDRALGLVPDGDLKKIYPSPVMAAFRILAMFPHLPEKYIPALVRFAAGLWAYRQPAQDLLGRVPGVLEIAAQTLTDPKPGIRASGAAWIGRIGDPTGIACLRATLVQESHVQPRAAMLGALAKLGDDVSDYLVPSVLADEARTGLKRKLPSRIPLEALPQCRWADGTAVEPETIRWWAVLAVRLRDPLGAGLIRLYVSLLDQRSQESLGAFALDTWIGLDTAHPGEEECRAYAEANVDSQYQWAQQWGDSNVTKDQIFEQLRRKKSRELVGDAKNEKGLLALTVGADGPYFYSTCQRYAKTYGRQAQVRALLTAASINDSLAAIQFVLDIAHNYRKTQVRAFASDLAEAIAQCKGWSMEELTDRAIPRAGFDEGGLLTLDYGGRRFTGRITRSSKGAWTIALSNQEGKSIASLPKPGVKDDKELAAKSRRRLSDSRKELGQVVASQRTRLFEAMCLGRSWEGSAWREIFLGHPVMAHLISTLVWTATCDNAYQTFRPTVDEGLVGADDQTVTLPDDAHVSLAHRAIIGGIESRRWKAHLSDYEIVPLFPQFDSAPPQVVDGTEFINDHAGWVVDSDVLHKMAIARGYERGRDDNGRYDHYDKMFFSAGIRVLITFSGCSRWEKTPAAMYSVSFEKDRRDLPISKVPPVLLVESYADYVYIAEAGIFDPRSSETA